MTRPSDPTGRVATRVVRFADLPVSQWANGLGETRELGSDRMADGRLVWRLSIATIAAASDFSELPEVDRRLMNLGAGPLSLMMDGEPVTVGRHGVVSFRGEDSVRAQHANGYDLNVMTRRGRATSSLEAAGVDGSRTFGGGPATLLAIVFLEGELVVRTGEPARRLGPLDCLIGGPREDITVDGDAVVALVRIVVGS